MHDFTPLTTSDTIVLIATSLEKKHRIANEYLPAASEALDILETAIVDQYGEEKMKALKVKQDTFKKRVVDHEKHAGLENPYDLPPPSGTSPTAVSNC